MEKQIVEINGVKFEVDMSSAKIISEYRIGAKVNVLIKEYAEKVVCPGIIVGFDNFKDLPTITVAYLKISYNEASIKFVYFNSDSKEVDIAPCRESDLIFNKSDVIVKMDREIAAKEKEVEDLIRKKNYFLDNFTKHFEAAMIANVNE